MGLFDSIFDLFGGRDSDDATSGDLEDESTVGSREDDATASRSGDRSASANGDRGPVIEDRARFGDADHVPPGCLVGDSVADLSEVAEEYADTWQEFGPTDYSVASIRGIDEMFATQQERANWLAIDLDDGRTGGFAPMAAQPACYFGEVLVRNYDADWVLDPDYGWALGFNGGTIVNLFGTAHRALEDEPPFVRLHDTFVANYGLDGTPLEPGGELLEERRQDAGIDPDEFDDELERAAGERESGPEQMRSFAADFVDTHSEYDLDYSVDSLSAVDAVFDDTFRTDAFADAQLGSTDDEASIVLTATASEAGGYFGEVVRRTTDAEWVHRDEDGLKLEFPADEADIRVDPIATATSAIEDDESFAVSYVELLETVDALEGELDEMGT